MKDHLIITISRTYGAGGCEIGQSIAEKLGIAYYDKAAIINRAIEQGHDPEIFQSLDDQLNGSFLYNLAMGIYTTAASANRRENTAEFSKNERLYRIQSEIVQQVAEEGPCVIIGSCGDYVLRDYPNCFKVFFHAPMESRIRRLTEQYGNPADGIGERLDRADRQRAYFYNYHTGRRWGATKNYHLSADTSMFSAEDLVELICFAIERRAPQLPPACLDDQMK